MEDITVIGYGSLMSGQGLSSSGTFQAKEAAIIALRGCTRGFAKLSRYGDRFAMDLEFTRPLPLEGSLVCPTSLPNGDVEALALTVPLDNLCRLAKREGYNPAVIQQLAEMAQAQGVGLARFLWELHAEAGHDRVGYRRQLFALTGFTSAHYIPHPVYVRDVGYALIFLAPGFEGTGSDAVIAVRQQTGVRTAMRIAETWLQKPTADQLAYFLVCLLAGVHGICVRDLLPTAHEAPELAGEVARRVAEALSQEVEYFLSATGIPRECYRRVFGEPETALGRSGLRTFLENGARSV